MKLKNVLIMLMVSLLILSLTSCGTRKKTKPATSSPATININDRNFSKEVTNFSGDALVLFYNKDYWQSVEMEKRFDHFAEMFKGEAKFCKFYWDIDADATAYYLEMLPTVVLYKNGKEIDRIKGIPPDEEALLKFNDDIELWIMKNVLELKGSQFQGNFTYRFNNGYKLQVSNY